MHNTRWVFGPGLGVARVGKSRTGGAERSGHLLSGSAARSVARVCLRAEARWSGHHSEREGWIDIHGDDGCLRASHVLPLGKVSACDYLAGELFADSVSSGTLIALTHITRRN